MTSHPVVRIGVSSCLLGQNVRYDGGHKRDPFLTGAACGRLVAFVPVCPEVELNLGTPREPIHLVRDGAKVRLVARESGKDLTDAMEDYARRRAAGLTGLSGYVFKKDSPSCGMERVKVRGDGKGGRGLFAAAVMDRWPLLPVEEEGRLQDPDLRENFFERVFAHRRLTDLFSGNWTAGRLVAFHAAEKLLLLSHDTEAYAALGRLTAGVKDRPRAAFAALYLKTFMEALAKPATARRHVNVLQHMAGYFKKVLSTPEKTELAQAIEDFRRGLAPLAVPVTLLRHHIRRHDVAYLAEQTYLDPHPKELKLRHHL
jgi:uncharacterized protein YbgA (DUF1722 family)/uncharacterized protein YbbK (DUF523 family)